MSPLMVADRVLIAGALSQGGLRGAGLQSQTVELDDVDGPR